MANDLAVQRRAPARAKRGRGIVRCNAWLGSCARLRCLPSRSNTFGGESDNGVALRRYLLTLFRRLDDQAEVVAGLLGKVIADRVDFFDDRIFRHASSFEKLNR